MEEGIFKSNRNEVSGRWVVFEDDGICGWMYLTSPNEQKPIADCWIYNRIPAPSPSEIDKFTGGPPPATTEYVSRDAVISYIDEAKISFRWSQDGNAVALLSDGVVLAYIDANNANGYSKNLVKSGPWGNMLNIESYQIRFNL